MQIGEVIRNHRKLKNLTQEQLAQYLGVSAPAVNKWENGNSYPDITLIAPLARVLGIDVNTLLCFREELTEQEIHQTAERLRQAFEQDGFDKGYEDALNILHEYPSSEILLLLVAQLLNEFIERSDIKENKEEYQQMVLKLYERASNSKDKRLSEAACVSLASKYIENREYEKAQELLDQIPESAFDKRTIQAQLYNKQGRVSEAYDLLERYLLQNASEAQAILNSLIHMSCEEKDYVTAKQYAAISEKTAALYDLWDYSKYTPHLEIAMLEQDKEAFYQVMDDIAQSLDKPWNLNEAFLYRHTKWNNKSSNMKDRLRSLFRDILETDENLQFIRTDERFEALVQKF